jgi:hypothetical protein
MAYSGSAHAIMVTPNEMETVMRKPRDFDAALKTLTDKAKSLQQTKRRQLGELIVATGADALDIEALAGGLLAMMQNTDAAQQQLWRKLGEEFFRNTKAAESGDPGHHESTQQNNAHPPQARSTTGQA